MTNIIQSDPPLATGYRVPTDIEAKTTGPAEPKAVPELRSIDQNLDGVAERLRMVLERLTVLDINIHGEQPEVPNIVVDDMLQAPGFIGALNHRHDILLSLAGALDGVTTRLERLA